MSDPQPKAKVLPLRTQSAPMPAEPIGHRVGRTLLENLSSLYIIAVCLTNSRDLAEDLAQETVAPSQSQLARCGPHAPAGPSRLVNLLS